MKFVQSISESTRRRKERNRVVGSLPLAGGGVKVSSRTMCLPHEQLDGCVDTHGLTPVVLSGALVVSIGVLHNYGSAPPALTLMKPQQLKSTGRSGIHRSA